MSPSEEATKRGATDVRRHINWTWAVGFPTKEACDGFVVWLEERGIETRGTYDLQYRDEGFGTRYR
jgi:hypothetical protein